MPLLGYASTASPTPGGRPRNWRAIFSTSNTLTPTMHPTIRKRVFSLDTDPVTNAGLVDESTTTSPPKKRSKTAMKKEVANDKQVRFPLTSKHDDDDDISMPYTPIRAAKSLPASHSDDEYKEPAPSPSPKPKSVKKAKKAAGTKNKAPKSRKAAVPKPRKMSAAERKALWVDWPKVFNTRYLPPPMDSDDENEDEIDEEIEHDDEYDSDL